MLSTVTSYLVQKKGCVLPCIGEIRIHTRSAEFDPTSNVMLPPVDEIIYNPDQQSAISADLIEYVAKRENLDLETAEIYLKNYCEEWKNELNRGGEINFQSFGTLQKNAVGNIYFRPARQFSSFRMPVNAFPFAIESIQTKEVTTAAETVYFNENEDDDKAGKGWLWIAACLFLLAAVTIALHFYTHPFSVQNTGISKKYQVDSMKIENLSREVLK